mgnify:CR=1 FL=1|jgi:hypothetical protein
MEAGVLPVEDYLLPSIQLPHDVSTGLVETVGRILIAYRQ